MKKPTLKQLDLMVEMIDKGDTLYIFNARKALFIPITDEEVSDKICDHLEQLSHDIERNK